MSDEANDGVQPSVDGNQPQEEEGEGELSDLPPPAFPPGTRRHAAVRAWARERHTDDASGEVERGEFEEAFISPDEPIVRRKHPAFPDEAFISPDEPIIRNERVEVDPEEAVVTGMGGGGTVYPQSSIVQAGKDVEKLADVLETLVRDLRDEGTRSLRVEEDTPRFQAMLRSMLAGYLAGKAEGQG